MALTESERAALTQMLDTAPDLDRWRIRAHRLEVPERGSDLAIDAAIFPHMAISQLARMSLVLAGEHLRLALDAIQAKQLYPSSHFTVLRGVLVGASQAVWIRGPRLASPRCERVRRASISLTSSARRRITPLWTVRVGKLSGDCGGG
jgi:hypothetical protein